MIGHVDSQHAYLPQPHPTHAADPAATHMISATQTHHPTTLSIFLLLVYIPSPLFSMAHGITTTTFMNFGRPHFSRCIPALYISYAF